MIVTSFLGLRFLSHTYASIAPLCPASLIRSLQPFSRYTWQQGFRSIK